MSDNSISKHFDSFLARIDDHEPAERVLLATGAIELLRHMRSNSAALAMAEFLVGVHDFSWRNIPFSLTKTVMSDAYKKLVMDAGVPGPLVPEVLLTALLIFLGNAEDGDLTEDLLRGVVASVAEDIAAAAKDNKAEMPVAPDVFSPRLLKRVFEPAEFNEDAAKKLQARVVLFRALTATGSPGPEIRGLAFDNGTNRYFLLLETGEYLTVPKDYEHLTLTNESSDYKHLSPAALLTLVTIAEELEIYAIIDKAQLEFIQSGGLGKLTQQHFRGVTDVEDIAPLEHVFDIGREAARIGATGATGPVGATVRFPVPGTEMVVVLEASQDALGPYSTARLVTQDSAGHEIVVMRHETPRLYSLRGVYLFPLPDRLISLTAIF